MQDMNSLHGVEDLTTKSRGTTYLETESTGHGGAKRKSLRENRRKPCRLFTGGRADAAYDHSMEMDVLVGSFLTLSLGTRTVRIPDSYFALMSSGLMSPTKKLREQAPA